MPIQILPPQLANQIAAGEVVERPASVIKELVENSLDAGATRIDIEVEKGGAKLIRIRDNGSGIGKEELAIALARHATSKIASLDDLEAIMSFGFRGEALASISAVSRLTLTSRPAAQTEAWQAYAEGRDMDVTVKPAAHPPGTTLEVLDLFYNTPARRKFLRTEKTEFSHIDEVVRRIALSRFDVALTLTHNDKLIRQYRGAVDENQRLRRLGAICGTEFMEHALALEWQHGDMTLRGWVVAPAGIRPGNEIQYCYVNGRMIRDKVISHAIRQAYQDKLAGEHQPAFVLWLEIDPHQVDVNVHPAKHEVRFHQSRLVHDFICQGVASALREMVAVTPVSSAQAVVSGQEENRQTAGINPLTVPVKPAPVTAIATSARHEVSGQGQHGAGWPRQQSGYQPRESKLYQQLLETPVGSPVCEREATFHAELRPEAQVTTPLAANSQSLGRVLTIMRDRYAVVERDTGLALISLPAAARCLKQAQLLLAQDEQKSQPLLIPLRLKVTETERQTIAHHADLLQRAGIDLLCEDHHATLRTVPLPLRQQNLPKLIPLLLAFLERQGVASPAQLAQWLAGQLEEEHTSWNHAQAIALLAEVERLCPAQLKTPPPALLQPIDTATALSALTNE